MGWRRLCPAGCLEHPLSTGAQVRCRLVCCVSLVSVCGQAAGLQGAVFRGCSCTLASPGGFQAQAALFAYCCRGPIKTLCCSGAAPLVPCAFAVLVGAAGSVIAWQLCCTRTTGCAHAACFHVGRTTACMITNSRCTRCGCAC